MKKVFAFVCAALLVSVSIANAASHRHRHYGYRGGGTAAAAHFQNQFNKTPTDSCDRRKQPARAGSAFNHKSWLKPS
jgi:hypothetical protein